MCGIAGIITTDLNGTGLEKLYPMLQKLQHRGPDGTGLLTNCHFAMGSTRLSITGPSTIPIPMTDPDRQWGFVYNGEVYNLFSSDNQSDTVHVMNQLKEKLIGDDFDGMYSYCFFDLQGEKAVLSRDPFGIKPLFFFQSINELRFSSEIPALIQDNDQLLPISNQALLEYLSLGRRLGNETLFHNVYRLPAGSSLEVNIHRGFLEYIHHENGTMERAPENENMVDALRSSVLKCAQTDRPLGLFLSGGLDSTAIAYFLAENNMENISTFSLILKGDGVQKLSELNLPGNSWKKWKHYILVPTPEMLDAAFQKVLDITSEPCFPMSAIYTFLLSEMAASHGIKVILSGEGADELFLGYESYLNFVTNHGQSLEQFYFENPAAEWARTLVKDSEFHYRQITTKLNEIVGTQSSLLQKLFRAEQILSLSPLLDRIDQTSMYHSMEVRVPFLHGDVPRIAELWLETMKAEDINNTKPLLRRALSSVLHHKAVKVPKKPLRLNLKEYITKNRMNSLKELLLDKDVVSLLPIQLTSLEDFLNKVQNKPKEGELNLAMRLYQLCYYLQRFTNVRNK